MSATGLITRYYAAFNAGHMNTFLGLLHEDVKVRAVLRTLREEKAKKEL